MNMPKIRAFLRIFAWGSKPCRGAIHSVWSVRHEFFVIACGFGISLLSGVLTLAVLPLPVVISTAEEALRQVPGTLREASLALGARQSQAIIRVVLPVAMPDILTGAILGLARAAGETAVIMFTAAVFFTKAGLDSVFRPVMALPNHIYVLATSGTNIEKTLPLQYGTALVLLLLVLGMNLVAIIIRDRMQRRHGSN
jgi:ABC-type phosphate transport system, permease component